MQVEPEFLQPEHLQDVNVKYSNTKATKYQEALSVWLSHHYISPPKKFSITPLPGDASTRRYYRVKFKNSSLITMQLQPFLDLGDNLPFLQVQKHLSKLGISVPKIFDCDPKSGIILLQDLGDETLLKSLELVSKKQEQVAWFKKAIDLLLKMQTKATRNTAPIDAYGLYFDEEKLMWEVRFTLAHFYEGYLAQNIPAKELKIIEKYFAWICRTLASQTWVFTHRDYHSRNIMVCEDELFMIDFQDARMGCAQYDLASLLRDSYFQLDEDILCELLNYYLSKTQNTTEDFMKIFDLMSIQRNFKAIGSFASFYIKRKDARYLKFIGNTFENIRRNLLKFSELDELRRLLYRYYYF